MCQVSSDFFDFFKSAALAKQTWQNKMAELATIFYSFSIISVIFLRSQKRIATQDIRNW